MHDDGDHLVQRDPREQRDCQKCQDRSERLSRAKKIFACLGSCDYMCRHSVFEGPANLNNGALNTGPLRPRASEQLMVFLSIIVYGFVSATLFRCSFIGF